MFLPPIKYPAFSSASFGHDPSPPHRTPGGQQMATSLSQTLQSGAVTVELTVVELNPVGAEEFRNTALELVVMVVLLNPR